LEEHLEKMVKLLWVNGEEVEFCLVKYPGMEKKLLEVQRTVR
jgi:hypothetical protein